MRKVVAYELLSLDGVAEAPERFINVWDAVMDANLAEVIGAQDAVILGRRSYDEWAAYWPSSDEEPFATFINNVTKHVATSTPLGAGWDNSAAIEGDLGQFVRGLKAQPGADIGVHASISTCRALLAADLVDVIRLVIAPTLVSSGRRLFEDLPPMQMETVRCLTSPSGHLLVDFRVVRSA